MSHRPISTNGPDRRSASGATQSLSRRRQSFVVGTVAGEATRTLPEKLAGSLMVLSGCRSAMTVWPVRLAGVRSFTQNCRTTDREVDCGPGPTGLGDPRRAAARRRRAVARRFAPGGPADTRASVSQQEPGRSTARPSRAGTHSGGPAGSQRSGRGVERRTAAVGARPRRRALASAATRWCQPRRRQRPRSGTMWSPHTRSGPDDQRRPVGGAVYGLRHGRDLVRARR